MVNSPTIDCLRIWRFEPLPDKLRISVRAGEVMDVEGKKARMKSTRREDDFDLSLVPDKKITVFVGRWTGEEGLNSGVEFMEGKTTDTAIKSAVEDYRGRLQRLLDNLMFIPYDIGAWEPGTAHEWYSAHPEEGVAQEVAELAAQCRRIQFIKQFVMGIIHYGGHSRKITGASDEIIPEKEISDVGLPDHALVVSDFYESVSLASGMVFVSTRDNHVSIGALPFGIRETENLHYRTDADTDKPLLRVGGALLVSFSPLPG
jgi:hypothetical protein